MRIYKMLMVFILVLLLVPSSTLFSQSGETEQIFEKNLPSLISFVAFGEDKEEISQGTGFIIGEKIMATSYELVSQAKSAEGRDHKGKKIKLDGILALDKNFGIALVQINRKDPILPIGNSDAIERNQKVYAIGANEAGEFSLSEGETFNFHEYKSQRMIETSLSIADTYNGGPVLNAAGEVIGIVVFLDIGRKIIIPSKVLDLLPRTGAGTKFKSWQPEDYFATIEGVNLAARLFYSMNNTSKAEKFLKKVLEFTPDDLEIHGLMAEIYTKQRNYSSAISTYNKIIELDANNDAAHYGMGNVYIKMMNWKEAIPPLEKAVQLNLDYKDAYFQIASAFHELREFDNAADAYKKYIASGPQRAFDAYNRLGMCQMELQQYTDAVISFQEALKGMTDDVNITYKLAQSYEKAGQLEQAAETYYKLADLSPKDARIYFNTVINMYNAAKMPDKAAEAANKMIELNPNDPDALFNLGFMLVQMKKYEEAIEVLDKVIALTPEMEYAHLNKGFSFYNLKQYSKAIQAYSNTVKLFPENADAWMFLGMSHMQLKGWAKAVDPLSKSIELRPESGNAYYNLAICYLNLKDNYSARDIYNKLQSVDPNLAQKLKKYIK
ncbi:MAG: tetratricopeptide repeat protein [Candidatus Aminicenantes bacterium]|nr:MAG: tetratricopeptide repeat protein [Candidatus Aminicenantes bacterium]